MEPFSLAAAAVFYGLQSLFGSGSPPPQTTDYGIPVGPGTELASGEFEAGGMMAQTTPGTILPPWQFDVPSRTGLPVPVEPIPPTNVPSPIVGPPIPPTPGIPENVPPPIGGAGWLLRGLGGLGGLLWPSEIGEEWPPGTFPYDVGGATLPPTPTAEQLDRIAQPYGGYTPADLQRIQDQAQAAAEAWQAAGPPYPAAAPGPATTTAPAPQVGDRLWQWIALGLGGATLLSKALSSHPELSPQFIDPISVGALTSIEDALIGYAQGQGQAAPVTLVGGGGWGSTSSQYCTPRPRGPRRKCLQRAPVRYSGGPRKGKAAGTKCIRYATAKR